MTERDTLIRAHTYITQLANGFNPLSGDELPDDTVLNDVRLSRCFFYVAGVLDKVLAGDKTMLKRADVTLSAEFTARLTAAEIPLPISEFSKLVNAVAEEFGMKNIPLTAYTNWLVNQGILGEEIVNDRRHKTVGATAHQYGIYEETRTSLAHGDYTVVLYPPIAQRFLLDNLQEILNFRKAAKG
ncbi:MAG: hypothetical protein LBN02_05500 [Oscillospiraceae bacterium]|jgi:hypothetical protein|nr:hypothetical protein [Oscillospiraceae bacterium]